MSDTDIRSRQDAWIKQALGIDTQRGCSDPVWGASQALANGVGVGIRSPSTIPLNQAKQNKHVLGARNYIPGSSILTADAEALRQRYSGKGSQVGAKPVGETGSKEIFDTGDDIIGIFKDEDGHVAVETTKAIIHYAKNDVHIVPSRPRGWGRS